MVTNTHIVDFTSKIYYNLLMIINNIELYNGDLLHSRFAYTYFRDKTLPIGNIIAFRSPMHVEADGMIIERIL